MARFTAAFQLARAGVWTVRVDRAAGKAPPRVVSGERPTPLPFGGGRLGPRAITSV